MPLLHRITIELPPSCADFNQKLLSFLEQFGEREGNAVIFTESQPEFLPVIQIATCDTPVPRVVFQSDSSSTHVEITNTTGKEKASPHRYTPLNLEEVTQRLQGLELGNLDHAGFDLPWFDGTHPEILRLRAELPSQCAYHRWPEGEDWDFILPATPDEIGKKTPFDYTRTRRPKFEIVSIDKVSTPILQFDFSVKVTFETLRNLFPEGIAEPELKNVWVYLRSEMEIDICLVIGEDSDGDWSSFFQDSRLA